MPICHKIPGILRSSRYKFTYIIQKSPRCTESAVGEPQYGERLLYYKTARIKIYILTTFLLTWRVKWLFVACIVSENDFLYTVCKRTHDVNEWNQQLFKRLLYFIYWLLSVNFMIEIVKSIMNLKHRGTLNAI